VALVVLFESCNPMKSHKIATYGENIFQWNDDEVLFVLDQHALLDFYSVSSLKLQSADRHVAPLRHSFPIPSQAVFVLSP
jgi:hypothetical protein